MRRRVAIVGSRDHYDEEAIRRYVQSLPIETVIISGGARGVDSIAADAARLRGMIVAFVHPAWRDAKGRYQSRAGFERNAVIVEIADEVVAFWDGKSKGTENTIETARAADKPTLVHLYAGQP